MSKENRLSQDKDFKWIFRRGMKAENDYLIIKSFFNLKSEKRISRFGIVVSNKVSNKAVKRNKIKRRLRAIINQLIKTSSYYGDVLVMAKKGIDTLEFENIQEGLIKLLNQNDKRFFNRTPST